MPKLAFSDMKRKCLSGYATESLHKAFGYAPEALYAVYMHSFAIYVGFLVYDSSMLVTTKFEPIVALVAIGVDSRTAFNNHMDDRG